MPEFMPAEIRHIVFSNDEVLEAVRAFQQRERQPLLCGTVSRFELTERKGEVEARIEITPDGGQQKQAVVLERERLAAALISLCLARKIPLPLAAPKVCRLLWGRAALVMGLGVPPENFGKLATLL
jgi:hypothetical protein